LTVRVAQRVFFISRGGPGEAVHGGRVKTVMGLFRELRVAVVEGGSRSSCSLVRLFRSGALEEVSTVAERIYNGLDPGNSGGPLLGREPRLVFTSSFVQKWSSGVGVHSVGEGNEMGLRPQDPEPAVWEETAM
jgi:hypothetical protein